MQIDLSTLFNQKFFQGLLPQNNLFLKTLSQTLYITNIQQVLKLPQYVEMIYFSCQDLYN